MSNSHIYKRNKNVKFIIGDDDDEYEQPEDCNRNRQSLDYGLLLLDSCVVNEQPSMDSIYPTRRNTTIFIPKQQQTACSRFRKLLKFFK